MKNFKFRWIFLIYAMFLTFSVIYFIYPVCDDLYYAQPQPGKTLSQVFMPGQIMWRPFDRLVEYILGYFPSLFPNLNHVIDLTGHFISCAVLYFLLKNFVRDKKSILIGCLLFWLSPAIVHTVTNSDFFNQCLAFTAGILSGVLFFKAKLTNKKIYFTLWMISAFLSTLFKENGIVWFVMPVVFYVVYDYVILNKKFFDAIKGNIFYIILGLLVALLYFAIRFALLGKIALGNSIGVEGSAYSVNLTMKNILKNYTSIIGGSITAIDNLALFLKPRNWTILIISGVISVIFLVLLLTGLIKIFRNSKKLFVSIILIFFCAMLIVVPYVIMGHVREANGYEFAYIFAFISSLILSKIKWNYKILLIIVSFLVCMIFVDCHKFITLSRYGFEIEEFIQEHSKYFKNKPSKVFVYSIQDVSEEGFSIYSHSIQHGSSWGLAFKKIWGWDTEIVVKQIKNYSEINFSSDALPEYDTVFIFANSGKLNILRN